MNTTAPTRDQVLDLARRLSPADQAYLVAHLAPVIAEALETPARPPLTDPYAVLAEIREAFRRQGPTSPTMAEQLDADRRARDAALRGQD